MNPVVIDFQVRGMPDVNRALKSVESATIAAERAATRAAQKESKERERVYARQWQQVAQMAKREAQERERAANAGAAAQIKAWKKADSEQRKAQDAATRAVQRQLAVEQRMRERAAREQIRVEERTAADIARIKDKAARDVARSIARQEAEANRAASQWVRQRQAEQNQKAGERRAFFGAVAGAAAQGVGSGVSKVAGLTMQTAGIVGQLGGGFSVADSVQRTTALRGHLADIASRDQMALGPNKTKRISTAALEGTVRAATSEFGFDAEEGAKSLDVFAGKTGDLERGQQLLRGIAQMSRAGAGDMEKLASAAGEIFNSDRTQSAEQVLQQLRQFSVMGAQGSVEMRDMAGGLAKITASAGRFSGGAAREQLTFGALAQLAKESGGAASAPQALTAVQSLSNQFYKNARLGKMEALGVDVKNKEGFNRPVEDILMELMLGAEKKSRAGGKGLHDFDMLMGTAIADAQARKATTPLEKAFKEAGGGAAGVAAAKRELEKYGGGGRDLKGEFSSMAASRMGEDDMRMAQIKQEFDRTVSEKVIPALMRLIPEFEKLIPILVDLNATAMPAFVDLIKSVASFADQNKALINDIAAHPIGTIMAFEVSKSIATVGLGQVIKSLLEKAFTGGTVALPPGGVPGAGGATGVVGGGAPTSMAAGGLIAVGGVIQGAALSDAAGIVTGGQTAGANTAADMVRRARGGELASVQAQRAKAEEDASAGAGAGAYLTVASRASTYTNPLAYLSQYLTDKAAESSGGAVDKKRAEKYFTAKEVVDSESVKKAIADAVREGAKQGMSEGTAAGVPGASRGTTMTGRN